MIWETGRQAIVGEQNLHEQVPDSVEADVVVLWHSRGADTLLGAEGHDSLMGGAGNDLALGGDGDDLIWGGDGKDTLSGQAGEEDRLFDATAAEMNEVFTFDNRFLFV